MHPGMTPSHPGATPGRDNAWVPVMATPAHPSSDAGGRSDAWAPVMSTPRHPPSESAWDPVRSNAAPAPINTGRTSGWEKGHAQYGAPSTSIPKAGKRTAALSPECSEIDLHLSQHAGICTCTSKLIYGTCNNKLNCCRAGDIGRRALLRCSLHLIWSLWAAVRGTVALWL